MKKPRKTGAFKAFSNGDTPYAPYVIPVPEPDAPETVEEAPPEPDPELVEANQQLIQLQLELEESAKKIASLEANLVEKESESLELVECYDQAVKQFGKELQQHFAGTLIQSINGIVTMPGFLDEVLVQRIGEAIKELSDAKKVCVTVNSNQKERAEDLLKNFPAWTVVTSEEMSGGAIFETEIGQWNAQIDIAITEAQEIISAWLQERFQQ